MTPWSHSHFSGMTVLIFNLQWENSKPDWQWYNSLCLARGSQKLFTDEKVRIKYPAIKNKVFFFHRQRSRAISDCSIQHFAECPVIVFRWKILISPLRFSLFSHGTLGISYNEILVTECCFISGEWYNLVALFIPLRNIKKLCHKKKEKHTLAPLCEHCPYWFLKANQSQSCHLKLHTLLSQLSVHALLSFSLYQSLLLCFQDCVLFVVCLV